MIDRLAASQEAQLTPKRARVELVLFAVMGAFFAAVTLSPLRSGFADAPDRGPGDVELYRAEVDRIRGGESYYDAAACELRQRGYPTRSVFNWRTPLPVWLVAKLPGLQWSNALLGVLGLALLCLSFRLLVEDGGLHQGFLGVLLLSGALLPCVLGELVVMSELWSGVLIALSAVSFGVGRRKLGLAAAVTALVFRELAAPFYLICTAISASERRWREVACWVAGLAIYALYFGFHISNVLPRINSADTTGAEGWIRFGGAGFLISTTQMNAYLLLLPQWAAAVYLACTLLGATNWNSSAGRLIAITIAGYSAAFSIAGNDFNQYWGSMTAPLFCLAACRAPRVLVRLCQLAIGQGAAPSQRSASLIG